MKFSLKLLLLLLILCVAIYVSFPAWFPRVLSTQLPAGWELEEVDADYPGMSGIRLISLKVKSHLQAADVLISASDISFEYKSFKTGVNSVTLDVSLLNAKSSSEDTMTLDDLSLPVIDLAGEIPAISVSSLRLRLHRASTGIFGTVKPVQPLVMDFGSLNLVPGPQNSFHLVTEVSFETIPVAPGLLKLDFNPQSQKVKIHFPADPASSKWLSVTAERIAQKTRIQATLDTNSIDRQWLDSILLASTGGLLEHMQGQLRTSAEFAGPGPHKVQWLSLGTENLQLRADGESMQLRTSLLATVEEQEILVSLQDRTNVRYLDETGRIDQLLRSAIPGFQRAPRAGVNTEMNIEPGSRFTVRPGEAVAIDFNGDFRFDLESGDETINIASDDISVFINDFPRLETMTIDGPVHIDWNEQTAVHFSYPGLQMTADSLSASAELTSTGTRLVSTGHGMLFGWSLVDMGTTVKHLDMRWQELDLFNHTGQFLTQTQGFSTPVGGDIWTGFDFDLNYRLMNDDKVDGSGTVIIENGPKLPVEFNGSVSPQLWKITLPASSMNAAQVVRLLKVAKLNLPANLKLDDGLLEIQGTITVDDAINAYITFRGNQFDASIKESRVNDADFNLEAVLEQDMSINGPITIDEISLAGGIDLVRFSAGLNMTRAGSLTIKDIHAEVFEGQLALAQLQYANGEIGDTRANFTHLNLERLLAFTNIDGLNGSGHLDISLPVSQKPSGMVIRNGTFNSTGTGRLSYARKGVVAANIGMQALENFHYKHLSGTIDYKADGEYLIGIRLEGSNPDLYDGYPVIFNLNINGVMPELFESMFITGSFEEAILKQVQSR